MTQEKRDNSGARNADASFPKSSASLPSLPGEQTTKDLEEPRAARRARTVKGQMELNDLLNEIEARAEKATAGPWEVDTCVVIGRCRQDDSGARRHIDGGFYGVICETGDYDDCRSLEFIAASRTDVPALVKALRYAMKHWGHGVEAEIAAILERKHIHDAREPF